MPSQSSPSLPSAPAAHGSIGVSSMRLPLAGGGGGEADGGGGGGAMLALQTPLLQKGSVVEHTWRRASPRVSGPGGGVAGRARAAGAPVAGPGAHVAAVAAVVDVGDQVGLAAGAGGVGAVQRAGQRLQPGRWRARRVAVAAEAGVVGLANAVQVAGLCARAGPRGGPLGPARRARTFHSLTLPRGNRQTVAFSSVP